MDLKGKIMGWTPLIIGTLIALLAGLASYLIWREK
jgi:hypothetical protein